jgi:hypothetical protein
MRRILRKAVLSVLGLSVAGSGIGCASSAGNGALIGGGTGAALGAIIGKQSHGKTVNGALIGGAVGALAGGVIGSEMDKNDRRDRYYDDYNYGRRSDRYYERDDHRYPPPPDDYYEYREARGYRGY